MKPATLLVTARRLSKPHFAHGVGSFRRTISGAEVQITYTAVNRFYAIECETKVLAWGPRRSVLPTLTALIDGRQVVDSSGIVLLEARPA